MAKQFGRFGKLGRGIMAATRRLDRLSISVGTAQTTLLHLESVPPTIVEGSTIFALAFSNTGAAPLNSFAIQVRNTSQGDWRDAVTTGLAFTTLPARLQGLLLGSDDEVDPTILAVGQTWEGAIDLKAVFQVRVVATVASGTTTVLVEVN